MPTAISFPTNVDDASGRQTPKSTCLKKSKATYDQSIAEEKCIKNTGKSNVPTHNLMIEPAAASANERSAFDLTSPDQASESSKLRSVYEEVQPTEENSSESFSKKVLYQKWTTACARASEMKSTLVSVRKELNDLNKEKCFAVYE